MGAQQLQTTNIYYVQLRQDYVEYLLLDDRAIYMNFLY
jgi:hypothetical protein